MNEIKCPNCDRAFSVDEASYASVVNQGGRTLFCVERDLAKGRSTYKP